MRDLLEITNEVLSLSVAQRRSLVLKILDSIQKEERAVELNERMRIVREATEKAMGITLDNTRCREQVLAKMFITEILNRDGFSLSRIGKALGKDHSTTVYYSHTMKDMMSLPEIYAAELDMFDNINKLLIETSIKNEDQISQT